MVDNIIFDDLRNTYAYDVAYFSGIGRRESQQDSGYVAAGDTDVLAIVCDGMGGLAGGETASAAAVEAFIELYQYYSEAKPELSASIWLQNAAHFVDDVVYSLQNTAGERLRAGTTLTVAVIHRNDFYWLSVGDSRIYLSRGSDMVRITNDHNYFMQLNEQRSKGTISPQKYQEEAKKGEALISFIGMGGLLLLDINDTAFQLERGDIVLLCSDGLYRTLSEKEIQTVLQNYETAEEMSCCLNQMLAGKASAIQDNYTYIIIKKA